MSRRIKAAGFLLLAAALAGVAFAAAGFITTDKGLQYMELRPGAGGRAEAGDVVTIHFTGWLDDKGEKGKKIYNTRGHDKPVSFVLGTDRVMQGWNDGVIGMRPGGKRLVKVPAELGYGSRGVQDVVPPGAGLIFVIDLLEIEKRSE